MEFYPNVRIVDTRNTFLNLKNWASKSRIQILLNNLFTLESATFVGEEHIQKISQARKWLERFSSLHNIDIVNTHPNLISNQSLISQAPDREVYNLANDIIRKTRESRFCLSLGCLDYLETALETNANQVFIITLEKEYLFNPITLNPLIYSHPNVNILITDCIVSGIYEIVKDIK